VFTLEDGGISKGSEEIICEDPNFIYGINLIACVNILNKRIV
jgi:hypothetical protein